MFKTTEQHEEFRAKVRAWAEEVVKPIAVELDLDNKFPDERNGKKETRHNGHSL